MPKFAVYYVPQADDPFYLAESGLLGYDVRARQTATPSPEQAALLGTLFRAYKTLPIQTICLLIQDDDETNWQIYREFHR